MRILFTKSRFNAAGFSNSLLRPSPVAARRRLHGPLPVSLVPVLSNLQHEQQVIGDGGVIEMVTVSQSDTDAESGVPLIVT